MSVPSETNVRYALDAAAGGTAIATVAGWLPPVAALFTIIWLAMQMYGWVRRKDWLNDSEKNRGDGP